MGGLEATWALRFALLATGQDAEAQRVVQWEAPGPVKEEAYGSLFLERGEPAKALDAFGEEACTAYRCVTMLIHNAESVKGFDERGRLARLRNAVWFGQLRPAIASRLGEASKRGAEPASVADANAKLACFEDALVNAGNALAAALPRSGLGCREARSALEKARALRATDVPTRDNMLLLDRDCAR
jgi:hypothetical protein